MLTFILLNLCVAFLLKTDFFTLSFFQSKFSFFIGITLLIVNFVAMAIKFKKLPFKWRYDLFAVGSVLVWLFYWPPFFRVESPVFYSFLLYFAFISALFSTVFVTKRENMEPEAIDYLQWLSNSGRFNPLIIMIGVMISLAFPQHFLLFPITVTLLVIRYSLACCLNEK